MAQLRQAQADVARVKVTEETVQALIAIRDGCRAEGIVASDRRWKKTLKVVQATAYLAGEAATTPEDLLVLTHALWREPKEYTKGRARGRAARRSREREGRGGPRRRAGDRRARRGAPQLRPEELPRAGGAGPRGVQGPATKLKDLASGAGPRAKQALGDADQEIAQLHYELARAVSVGLGLGGAR
jgi:MoxR-like ATPase